MTYSLPHISDLESLLGLATSEQVKKSYLPSQERKKIFKRTGLQGRLETIFYHKQNPHCISEISVLYISETVIGDKLNPPKDIIQCHKYNLRVNTELYFPKKL